MNMFAWLEFTVFIGVLTAVTPRLGAYTNDHRRPDRTPRDHQAAWRKRRRICCCKLRCTERKPNAPYGLRAIVAMFVIGAGLTNMFGRLIGDVRQGWMLYAVMMLLFVVGFAAVWGAEHAGNPLVRQLGVHGPNMEGKEQRFGDTASALSVTVATDTSTTPLFGMLLAATALVVTALTFVPADALGPVVEQLLLRAGSSF